MSSTPFAVFMSSTSFRGCFYAVNTSQYLPIPPNTSNSGPKASGWFGVLGKGGVPVGWLRDLLGQLEQVSDTVGQIGVVQ